MSWFLFFVLILNLLVFFQAIQVALRQHNPYKETYFLWGLGIFVWGDALIIAPFWLGLLLATWITKHSMLFWFGTSLFWLVRAFGETAYWMHEQFATKPRNLPENLFGHAIIRSDAITFIYQVIWQCLTVCFGIGALWTGVLFVRLL